MKEKKKIVNRNIIAKCIKRLILILFMIINLFVTYTSHVFGANDPLSVINNFSVFTFSLVRGIGMILMLWGIVQIGMALKSHDPSQRASRIYDISRCNSNNIC